INNVCSFFFQAEDGIRDFHVTGVQTCALPISTLTSRSAEKRETQNSGVYKKTHSLGALDSYSLVSVRGCLTGPISPINFTKSTRSEERRVGKECRSREWPEH